MPRAGGLDDQDQEWVEDAMLYLALERRIKWEKREDEYTPDEEGRKGVRLDELD
jgi:hypothetical protein